ncbi:sulfotransferase [Ekhidna sp. MALMAid0563]|uniref:sulfotransferase family protein n=1 Tax=Ekhidna sp. MALMAid0563 TaxID=3143937 RepID=UPI0032DE3AD2
MKIENWPNFIIVGSGKSGSTSLYNYLSQHPEIFTSRVKEPGYFEWYGVKPSFKGPKDDIHINKYAVYKKKEYLNLFNRSHQYKAVGEASVRYFISEKAAKNIKSNIPNCKIIILIRNPIERAFSSYQMSVRDRKEHLSFLEAVNEKEKREKENWARACFLRAGFYSENIKRYQTLFGEDSVLLLFTEDLNKKPQQEVKKAFKFLGVDTSFIANTAIIHNKSGIPKNKALHSFMTRLDDFIGWTRPLRNYVRLHTPDLDKKLSNLYRHLRGIYQTKYLRSQSMTLEERNFLKKIYANEIAELSKMLKRDLSHWMN